MTVAFAISGSDPSAPWTLSHRVMRVGEGATTKLAVGLTRHSNCDGAKAVPVVKLLRPAHFLETPLPRRSTNWSGS